MNYKIYPTPEFKKRFKRLHKKYPTLKDDLSKVIQILQAKPDSGISLGFNLYKIRLAISSKGKGKSGGARIITYLITEHKEIYLVYIYDKSQLENITKEKLTKLIKDSGLNS
ncbi:MAG: type II toxin-antitoxin system RelE/ParE family toxin [Mariniphaga sp.]